MQKQVRRLSVCLFFALCSCAMPEYKPYTSPEANKISEKLDKKDAVGVLNELIEQRSVVFRGGPALNQDGRVVAAQFTEKLMGFHLSGMQISFFERGDYIKTSPDGRRTHYEAVRFVGEWPYEDVLAVDIAQADGKEVSTSSSKEKVISLALNRVWGNNMTTEISFYNARIIFAADSSAVNAFVGAMKVLCPKALVRTQLEK